MEPARPTKSFPYDGTVEDIFTGEPTLPPVPPKPKRERPKKEKPDKHTLSLDLK